MSCSPHDIGGLGIPPSLSQVVDEDTQFERHISASRIVEVEAGERRAELLQKRHEFSSGNIGTKSLFHAEGQACSRTSQLCHNPHVIGRHVRVHIYSEVASALSELPSIRGDLRVWPPADARMCRKIPRMSRRTMPPKIVRGAYDHLTLLARDRDGDHVLLDHLTETHAGIKALSHNVRFLVRDSDIEADVGICRKEG